MGIYSATKFALTAMSDSLRSELAGSGIGVSTIYPGLTQTSFMENMTQEVATRILQSIRLGLRDAYVSPEDIAAVGLNTIAPQLVDWTMRTFMGHPPPIDTFDADTSTTRLRPDVEPTESG
jgi:short-subunit dehydrogenase